MNQRSFKSLYIVITVLAFLPVIFPIYSLANSAEPMVLGLPFSFFWVLLWVVIVGIAVVSLYLIDPENKRKEDDS